MTEPVVPLTALSEAQRTQALERFAIIRPALEEGISQAQVARISKQASSTIRLWIKRYRDRETSVDQLAKEIDRLITERARQVLREEQAGG